MPKLDTLNFPQQIANWTELGTEVDCAASPTLKLETVGMFGVFKLLNTGATQTAILAAPTKSGICVTLMMAAQTSADTIAVTVKNSAGATTYTDTFTTLGQYQEYISVGTMDLTTGVKSYAWSHRFAMGSTPSVTTLAASGGIAAFGASVPVSQPASANQAALVDSTGGTAALTFAAITAGSSYAQADMVAAKNALSQLVLSFNALRSALVAEGLIKGSA